MNPRKFLKIHPHVSTYSLHPNLTWLSIQVPTLHYIQTVTIKLFTQNLILKSIIPHLILVWFGTIKIQMLILSEEQLISWTGKEFSKTKCGWEGLNLY